MTGSPRTGSLRRLYDGKLLSPARRRACVEHVRSELKLSERRICRVHGQHRSTQRKVPRGRDDEAALTADIVALARSLADFAKLVELFDAHGVSFVLVPQQFNTTTSMGRLTLNVLLSFAQFEREVTSERIRDKIAASKRKGIWVGGMVPLGYEVRGRKLVIIKEEAERVRDIFRRYLELGSLNLLLADLHQRGIVTKVRTLATGRTVGGIPLSRGPLAHLLRNRFYIGEVEYKGQVFPGEQPAILDGGLFEAVQAKLSEQRNHLVTRRSRSQALLQGILFDDRGNRMSPTHAAKKEVCYRYYASAALFQGIPEQAGTVSRVPAAEVEQRVLDAVRQRRGLPAPEDDRTVIAIHVERVAIRSDAILVTLRPSPEQHGSQDGPDNKDDGRHSEGSDTITIPWRKTPSRQPREIIVPQGSDDYRPARVETNRKLIAAIACGRRWLQEILSSTETVEAIAAREECSVRRVDMTLQMAFLSPHLVKAAVDRRLPRGIGVSRLFGLPPEWDRQHQALGLPMA